MLKLSNLSLLFLGGFIFTNFLNPAEYFSIDYPHLPQVCILFSLISLILFSIVASEKLYPFNPPNVILLLLVVCTLFTTFFRTIDPAHSRETLEIFLKGCVVYFLVVSIISNYERLRILLYVFAGCITVNAYKLTHDPIWDKGRAWVEGSTLIKDPNDATMVFTCGLPLLVGLMLTTKNKLLQLLFAYATFTLFMAVVEARSRGGFLALLAMLFVALFLQKNMKKRVLAVAVAIPLFALFSLRYVPDSYFQRILEIVDIQSDETGSAQARKGAMAISLRYIATHPLSDYGPGNHSYHVAQERGENIQEISEEARGSYLTHSLLLQYGHDNGLVPMLVYVGWIGAVFFLLLKTLLQMRKIANADMERLIASLIVLYSGFFVGAMFLPFAYRLFVFYFSAIPVAACQVALEGSSVPEKAKRKTENGTKKLIGISWTWKRKNSHKPPQKNYLRKTSASRKERA